MVGATLSRDRQQALEVARRREPEEDRPGVVVAFKTFAPGSCSQCGQGAFVLRKDGEFICATCWVSERRGVPA